MNQSGVTKAIRLAADGFFSNELLKSFFYKEIN